MMQVLPELNYVLAYTNPTLIRRFQRRYPQFAEQADAIFKNMLKYLWLSKKHQHDVQNNPQYPDLQFAPAIHEEMEAIDCMWHEFIILTKDYANFCEGYFGEFLHHIPEEETTTQTAEQFEQELRLYLNYIYNHLGEETLTEWFE